MMRRLSGGLLILVALAGVGAGCGAQRGKPYTAAGTTACLEKGGFTHVTTSPLKIGLIAASSANGGLQARSPSDNVLTIAFGAGPADVKPTEKAFTSHATPFYRQRMNEIMQSKGNAVLVWTEAPTADELAAAEKCLAP